MSYDKVVKHYKILLGKDLYPFVKKFVVGEFVIDDLTGRIHQVEKIVAKTGRDAWQGDWIKIDVNIPHKNCDKTTYVDEGWRHEWEIWHVERIEDAKNPPVV
jgi:hypothetical protein